MTPKQQQQFQQNMKDLKEITDKYKKEIKYIYDKIGINDIQDFEKILQTYNKYKDKYNNINSISDLISFLCGIQDSITDFFEEKGFSDIDDITTFINRNKTYIDIENDIVDYNLSLNKKENIVEDYYTNYIKYDSIYNRNIINVNYKNNTLKRDIKIPTTSTSETKIYSKVNFNNAFYNKYLNKLIKGNRKITEDKFIIDKYNDYMEDMYLDNEIYDNKWIIYSYNSINNKLIKNTSRKKNEKTDQHVVVDEILNKLNSNLKNILNKDTVLYDILYKKNRNDINMYSYMYWNNKTIEYIKNIDIKLDPNKSRFKLMLKLFANITKNKKIYNSEFIFNYYTFKKLNNTGLNILIPKLEDLCKNTQIDDDEEKKENLNYGPFEEFCNECQNILNKEEINIGYCKKCQNKMENMEKNDGINTWSEYECDDD